MKFATTLSLLASTAIAAPAVVTVTQHVHQTQMVTVEGLVYQENGEFKTTYTTVGAVPTATLQAVENQNVETQNTNVVTQVAAVTIVASQKVDSATVAPTTTPAAVEPTTTSTPAPVQTTPVTSNIQKQATSSAPAPSTAAAAASSNLEDWAQQILDETNKKRALHVDTGSLTWSQELAQYAQNYADKYDCSGNLVHSGGPYGENLALGYTPTGSVDAWYDEGTNYDYSNPQYSSATGHFTQLIWKGSTLVGCGIKNCNNEWGQYVICSYQAPGNVIGEFSENIMPLN
ncbi:hypothetical protein TBLA_0D05340 [Henningerozyma blattae CBS 6284]|uniref:SCP domain-containing protein n=1 Tax=Henningerozyma blattae (strain ATCC 34711 / CBS 6284 / DSM 70876 / NBRC 10599 / NRRL Y-10934 / UCD 77-7) TaxID=1071380 RepID=I2H3S5_HENB6|nr:hypothetical protein TBLA_0D05340 [Tetrapisispora blattae CBS 6284]CCH61027.1 hypothetical protein TBLA_0D05340 [Tetrapisispora blattae CBS 6284]